MFMRSNRRPPRDRSVLYGNRSTAAGRSEQSSRSICSACDSDLNERYRSTAVLGLRFFTCDVCETVYADVERPPRCSNCEADPVVEINPETQAVAYFTGR